MFLRREDGELHSTRRRIAPHVTSWGGMEQHGAAWSTMERHVAPRLLHSHGCVRKHHSRGILCSLMRAPTILGCRFRTRPRLILYFPASLPAAAARKDLSEIHSIPLLWEELCLLRTNRSHSRKLCFSSLTAQETNTNVIQTSLHCAGMHCDLQGSPPVIHLLLTSRAE